MIRPLRARHRRMILMLAVVAPVLLVLGLLARRPIPTADPGSIEAGPNPAEGFVAVGKSDDAWEGLAARTTWLREDGPAARLAVAIELLDNPKRPDLLVYWTGVGATGDTLPFDVFLLGAIDGRQRFTGVLPDAVEGVSGELILYSLARREIVSTAAVPRLAAASEGHGS